MQRIGIIGPESCGKTTLAEHLAKKYQGVFIPEYARTYLEERQTTIYSLEDVLAIAERQKEELLHPEKLFPTQSSEPIYFYDTELIITKVWLLHKYHFCPEWIDELLRSCPMDLYLICSPDIPFIEDPLRENEHLREYFFDWYLREVQDLKIPCSIVTGDRGAVSL